jgi:hypothetical protein
LPNGKKKSSSEKTRRHWELSHFSQTPEEKERRVAKARKDGQRGIRSRQDINLMRDIMNKVLDKLPPRELEEL